mgnify:CR=1 FL=1
MTTAAIESSPRSLSEIQAPVRAELDKVIGEMSRILSQDLPFLDQITAHLMGMRGKLFRPTIVLLASRSAGRSEERATTLAATVELIHLATLVHDDAIDHSVLRRGYRRLMIIGDCVGRCRDMPASLSFTRRSLWGLLREVAHVTQSGRDSYVVRVDLRRCIRLPGVGCWPR